LKVTLHDVAKLAGVSIKTVSRVVNDQGEISEATRARVQAAIAQLGYRPNILARSLVSQRSNMLGVVAWGIDYYAPSRIVVGVEQKSNELGYSLFLNLVPHPDGSDTARILDTFVDHRVDGIIWAIPEVGTNRAWLDTVKMDNLPPIVFMNMQARPGLTCISIDNRSGGFQATQHLVNLGRQSIGLISGPAGWWETQERAAGWQEALEQAGLDAKPTRIAESDWSAESGAAAMRVLLERKPDLDAVFASSDQIALGAMNVITQAGRRVPGDIAIVGFDNIPESAYFQPPLSTIHHPLSDIGSLAVEHLHCMISAKHSKNGYYEPVAVLQKPTLIIRSSSSK
jgi:LacI family transcriptional regulator